MGRDIHEILTILDENTREKLTSSIDQILNDEITTETRRTVILSARDGVERIIAKSAAPIRDGPPGIRRGHRASQLVEERAHPVARGHRQAHRLHRRDALGFAQRCARAVCAHHNFPVRDDYLREALKVVNDPTILVNVISRRVKQLRRGNRPLVESLEKLSAEDTALREVAEGKISYELATPEELAQL